MSPYLLFVVTVLGWVGAIVGLIAYLQVSRGRWAPTSLPFQLSNLCATSLMFLVAAVNGVWPSAAANIAWMVIGAQALLVIARARRAARPTTVELPLVAEDVAITRIDVTPAEPAVERFAVAAPAPVLR
ncbi:hypothetical protein GCM10009718_17760 [Isoptericola halotolerans]|uniref:Anti-sigma-YlaC factor YlaD n=1 Tax=Isoptericola halotolerans TaxID=300560 RepID=A0ABX2A700_9MICO|nr:hypothetical protein [Isoptericola halotolerans]NOV98637.1 putative anti-sigma-YlaC factor YlaD [Isoptericola halotolerans]